MGKTKKSKSKENERTEKTEEASKRKKETKKEKKEREKRVKKMLQMDDGGTTGGTTGGGTTTGTTTTDMTSTGGGTTGDGGTTGTGTGGASTQALGGIPKMKPDKATKELYAMIGRLLTQHEWYHGIMPREEVEEMLPRDGDFLVRKTTLKRQIRFCLSAKAGKIVKHLPLDYNNGEWSLTEQKFPSLDVMITTYLQSGLKIGETGVTLRNAVNRPDFYLLHENITVEKRIGGGAFGDVHIGSVVLKDGKQVKAAIKKIKGRVKKTHVTEFVKEAKLMRRFTHPNIVKMYGVAPQEEPLMIVLELAAGGSLRKYLKKNPHPENITQEELMGFARDAARGMCYLSAMSVIHRDLAARNCLLGEKQEVKISDFGLSVADQSEIRMERLKNVPIKWLSPETINEGVFTTKTDVWSFGVLLWEIFSKCKSDPFPKQSNAVAKEKILGNKPPMDAPDGAHEVIKTTMVECFTKNPADRIDFAGVMKRLAPDEIPPSADPKTGRIEVVE